MCSGPSVGLLPSSYHASALLAISCYLKVPTASLLVYPDGCLTAGYPIRLGASVGVEEVLASTVDAVDVNPSGGHFSDAEHASHGVRWTTAAELVLVYTYH